MRALLRLHKIFWAFARRNLFFALYIDVYRRKLSSQSCSCEDDLRLRTRARRLRSAFEDLGPTFIKLGQILARREDLLPPAYIEELTGLQEHARPVTFEELGASLRAKCICSEMTLPDHSIDRKCFHCRGIEEVFERFDRVPLATASLAQIHRAELEGREVAVKLLKPHVLDQINLDLAVLWRVRRWLLRAIGLGRSINADDFYAEFRRSLQMEVDLKAEGLHMSMFREQNAPEAVAPEVFWGFKRDDILVMEFIDGKPLVEAPADAEAKRALAKRLSRNFLRQVFVHELFHADPHPGNVFLRGDDLVYLDMGAMGRLDNETLRGLQALFVAVTQHDVEGATDALLNLGNTTTVDRASLLIDIGLITEAYGARTGERWSDRILNAARVHSIRLPRAVILLTKALVLIESIALKLDPEFSLDSVMKEFVDELSAHEIKMAASHARRAASEYLSLFERLPGLIEQAVSRQAVAL